jgi:hypothetical protein
MKYTPCFAYKSTFRASPPLKIAEVPIHDCRRYQQLRGPETPESRASSSSSSTSSNYEVEVMERSSSSDSSSSSSSEGGVATTKKTDKKGKMRGGRPFNMQLGPSLIADPSSQNQVSWASVSATLVRLNVGMPEQCSDLLIDALFPPPSIFI